MVQHDAVLGDLDLGRLSNPGGHAINDGESLFDTSPSVIIGGADNEEDCALRLLNEVG